MNYVLLFVKMALCLSLVGANTHPTLLRALTVNSGGNQVQIRVSDRRQLAENAAFGNSGLGWRQA